MNNYLYFYNNFCDLNTVIHTKVDQLANNRLFTIFTYDLNEQLTKEKIINLQNLFTVVNHPVYFLVINNFELLNKEIVNSLLLFLEENNENIYCIFTSKYPNLVLDTIKSRCDVSFLPFANKAFDDLLKELAIKDNLIKQILKDNFFSKEEIVNFVQSDLPSFMEMVYLLLNNEFDKLNTILNYFSISAYGQANDKMLTSTKNYAYKLFICYLQYFALLLNQKNALRYAMQINQLILNTANTSNLLLCFNNLLGVILQWKQLPH